MLRKRWLPAGAALLLVVAGMLLIRAPAPPPATEFTKGYFNGERAFADLEAQVSLGPRIRGEDGHSTFIKWVSDAFSDAGWQVNIHATQYNGFPVQNIIAKRGAPEEGGDWVIVAAHYDSRMQADRDPAPENRILPVPGANDGASGVAVIVELARALPEIDGKEIWFVLFDAEDNGDIDGMPWIIGSTAFVRDLGEFASGRLPDAVVVIDMIGDADLNIHPENYSDPALVQAIWLQAAALGYEKEFQPINKYSMLDDHTPFVRAGIPAVLLIDFDYPYWHTVADTPDKTSPESLRAVGETLLAWLQR